MEDESAEMWINRVKNVNNTYSSLSPTYMVHSNIKYIVIGRAGSVCEKDFGRKQ